MRKRFTDADKWDHRWFRLLRPKMKCALQYVFDCCDVAGIWVADFDAMSFHVGETIDEIEFLEAFKEKISKFDNDKYHVEDFITFQYGDKEGVVAESNAVVKNAFAILKKNNLKFKGIVAPPKGGAGAPLAGVKEEEEEKDKGKEKNKTYSVSEISNANNRASNIVSQIFSKGQEEPWGPVTKLEIEAVKSFGGVIEILNSKKARSTIIREMKNVILEFQDTG